MKKVLFIYCPYAGENKIVGNLDYIQMRYQEYGYILTHFRYTKDDDINDAMAQVDHTFHHILIAGGDGTVNRVVTSMKNHGLNLPIATLPAGTANDFANLLGYNTGIRSSCDKILKGEIVNVDLGKVNDSYFVNVLSAGLFTEVSQKTPTILKNTFGKLAYYVSGVQELPRFRKMSLKVDSDSLSFEDNALIFFVFNGKTAGNLPLAYRSTVYDGMLDVLIIKGDNFGESIQAAFHFISGSRRKYPPGIVHFKTKSLKVDIDFNVTVDIDGEHGPDTPLDISCIEGGLKVIVPNKQIM